MKIRKLKIENYKIFDNIEFDFTDADGKTLDLIVLAGVNGCGKTTVLELIYNIYNLNLEPQPLLNIEIELLPLEADTVLNENKVSKLGWQILNLPYPLKKNSVVLKTNPLNSDIGFDAFFKYLNLVAQKSNVVFAPAKQMLGLITGKNQSILDLSSQKDSLKKGILDKIHEQVFKNKNEAPQKSIQHQINLLNKTVESVELNTTLIDIESQELIFKSGNGHKIYFEQLSHGEQHLIFRAFFLNQLNLKNSFILIDEPEAAFHPTWQQKIAKLYQNVGENNQVFLATHSPHVMASVPPESLFILYFDEKSGKIKVMNAAKAGLQTLGLEPNRILREVMGLDILRNYETQLAIDLLSSLVNFEQFESEKALDLIEKLTIQLGRQDPFIIRLEHQLLMLRRKKGNLETVAA
jgi:ABC-type lipoprotein export system ATPase subunit